MIRFMARNPSQVDGERYNGVEEEEHGEYMIYGIILNDALYT